MAKRKKAYATDSFGEALDANQGGRFKRSLGNQSKASGVSPNTSTFKAGSQKAGTTKTRKKKP